MKFKVQMKDPDTLHDAIQDACAKYVASIPDLTNEEREAVAEKRGDLLQSIASQWFEYGEYLTVEIDSDAKTIRVCDRNERYAES